MKHPLPKRAATHLLPLIPLLLLLSATGAEGGNADSERAGNADSERAENAEPETAQEADAGPEVIPEPAPVPPAPPLRFTNMESTARARAGHARGLALADVDGDLTPELFSTPLDLPGIETVGDTSIAVADFDNDGDLDLFVTRSAGHPNLLLENRLETLLESGGGTGAKSAPFAVASAGELGSGAEADSVAACWGDFDADGHLDLFVVNGSGEDDLLYLSRGDGTFARVTEGVAVGNGGDGRSCAAGDLNADGAPDLYVGNFADGERAAENFLYLNSGDGHFIERPFSIAVTARGHTAGVSLVDYDYDHDLDLFVANAGPEEMNVLFLNDGTARFSRVFESPLAGDGETRSGAHTWGDFDNDGHLDIYVANGLGTDSGQSNQLFLSDGKGSFAAGDAGEAVAASAVSLATASADADRDGDLDLFVAGDSGDAKYENPASGHSWIELRLHGVDSNRMGLGARVTVRARVDRKNLRMTRWLLSGNGQSEPVLRFGFGGHGRPVELEIAWPSGTVDTHASLRPRRSYLAVEGGELTEQ